MIALSDDRLPMIDTHVHFWDQRRAPYGLTWSWLDPESDHPILGDIDCVKSLRYDIEGVWAEARFAGVEAFVHVQAALGSADPVDETRWLEEMRAKAPVPFTMVGHADLARVGDIERQLDEHLTVSSAFVGVRDFAVESVLRNRDSNQLDAGLRALSRRGLVLDLDCEWPNMGEAERLAARHPTLNVVLEHMGFPRSRSDDYFANWSRALRSLARVDTITCKVSGLGMTDPRFTTSSLKPWVETCLEAFGVSRVVFGTNWPIDRLYSSYDALTKVIREIVGGLSMEEQRQVLAENASRLYSLNHGQ